jgi:hypothetical protein
LRLAWSIWKPRWKDCKTPSIGKSVLEDRQFAKLGRRTEPHEMARALSEDARRHGV